MPEMRDAAELGKLLQAWRARMLPSDDVPLIADYGARRTPGLRREEVSGIACISTDYLKRLEQGRAHPSAAVVHALGEALRLTDAEVELALQLAGHAADRRGRVARNVPPSVHRLLERLSDSPIAVFDAAWTRIMQNEMWTGLTGDAQPLGSYQANIVWRLFNDDLGRIRHPSLEDHRKAMVADLRNVAVGYQDDAELAGMIDHLKAASADFTRMWEDPTVAHHGSTSKVVVHPQLGEIELDCDVLSVHGADLRIVVFTAPPLSAAEDVLRLLQVDSFQDRFAASASADR